MAWNLKVTKNVYFISVPGFKSGCLRMRHTQSCGGAEFRNGQIRGRYRERLVNALGKVFN